MRGLPCFFLLVSISAAGCGARVAPSDPGGQTSPSSPADAAADAASCTVLAASYDQTCTTDSDCVLVPAGGNYCDCNANSPVCLVCRVASVNAAASARYLAAIAAARSGDCPPQSCPMEGRPVCQGGSCTTSLGVTVCSN